SGFECNFLSSRTIEPREKNETTKPTPVVHLRPRLRPDIGLYFGFLSNFWRAGPSAGVLMMAEAEDSGGVGRLSRLEASYLDGPSKSSTALSFEALLDTLICLYDECCSSTLRKEKCVAEFVESVKPVVTQAKELRLCRDDFELLKVIGKGAFGEVAVVRMRGVGEIYAMKILNKWEMLKRAETACFREERDVLVYGDRRWITSLHFAFQDEKNLDMLDFPDEDVDWTISEEAKDLIRRLICPREVRLGKGGFADFRDHPFFAGVDWATIRDCKILNHFSFDQSADPPYHPEVSSPTDTSNFDVDICEDDFTPCETQPPRVTAAFTGHHLPFIGFTYTHGSLLSDAKSLGECLSRDKPGVGDQSAGAEAYEKRLRELEVEKHDLARKCQEANQLVQSFAGKSRSDEDKNYEQTIAQLRDEIQARAASILKTRLADETASKERAATAKDPDVEDLEKKVRELKEKNRQLILEKTELQRELEEGAEKLTIQTKEWKEAIKHRESAKADFEEVELEEGAEKLTIQTKEWKEAIKHRESAKADFEEVLNNELLDERSKARRLEKEAAETETRMAQLQSRVDTLKADLRKAESARQNIDMELEKAKQAAESERLLKEGLQAKLAAFGDETPGEEARRLGEELERLNERHTEIVAQEDKKRKQLVEHYQGQLAELQAQFDEKDVELRNARSRLEEERAQFALQQEQNSKNVEVQYDRLQKAFEENTAQLKLENDTLRAELSRLHSEIEMARPGINEQQLHEILNWVNEEKATREEMELLTRRITGDIETLKLQNGTNGGTYSNITTPASGWGSRRMNKAAKMEILDAKKALNAEIRAKCELQEELSKTRSALFASKARLDECEERLAAARKENETLKAELRAGNRDSVEDGRAFFNMVPEGRTSTPRESVHNSFNTDYEISNSRRYGVPGIPSPAPPPAYENTVRHSQTPSTASTMLVGNRGASPKEVFDVASLPSIRVAQCAVVIDRTKVVIGFADVGMYCVELDRETLVAVGGEKENKGRFVERVEFSPSEQLLLVMVGPPKERHVRLVPSAALDGRDLKWIKEVFDVASLPSIRVAQCAVVIDRTKVVIGFADVGMYCVELDRETLVAVGGEKENKGRFVERVEFSPSEQFLSQSNYEAQLMIEVAGESTEPLSREYLLVFDKIGLYVDAQDEDSLYVPHSMASNSSTSLPKRKQGKRKFSVRVPGKDESRPGDRRSNLPISGPSDFMHIVHMGPGSVHELQSFIDLQPQGGAHNQSAGERVRGLIPIMRSTSSSSASTHPVKQLGGSKQDIEQMHRTRPLSTTRSSLGRDGNTTTSSTSCENPYLEPTSKQQANLSALPQSPSSPLSRPQ
ncbi:protein kinase domain protein, partial [Teladorsagia circumcincta]